MRFFDFSGGTARSVYNRPKRGTGLMEEAVGESRLVERAVAGDQAALEQLLIRQHAALAAQLRPRLPEALRSTTSVEDVLQQAYVLVFERISTLEPRGARAFAAWVTTIADHCLTDAIRAEMAAKRGGAQNRVTSPAMSATDSVVHWLDRLAVHLRTPSQSAQEREALLRVQSAMDHLKAEHREALALRYLEGLSVADAAARMGRTEGAVCLLCHRALKRMQEALGVSH